MITVTRLHNLCAVDVTAAYRSTQLWDVEQRRALDVMEAWIVEAVKRDRPIVAFVIYAPAQRDFVDGRAVLTPETRLVYDVDGLRATLRTDASVYRREGLDVIECEG